MTDTERLDKLDNYASRKMICRWSESGRGFRLHETSRKGSSTNVRDAIDKFFAENGEDVK